MDITNIKSQAILKYFFGTLTPSYKKVIAVQNDLYERGETSIAFSVEHAIQFIEEEQPEEINFFKTVLKSDEWIKWKVSEENIGTWNLLYERQDFSGFIAISSDFGAIFGDLNGEIYSSSSRATKSFFEAYVPVQVDWNRD